MIFSEQHALKRRKKLLISITSKFSITISPTRRLEDVDMGSATLSNIWNTEEIVLAELFQKLIKNSGCFIFF